MMNHVKSGNKGEWSELYAFFRLLRDGRIYAADENVNRIENIYFPIIKINREEEIGTKYHYNTGEPIRIFRNGEFITEVSSDTLSESADILYQKIFKGAKGQLSNGSFHVDEISGILESMHIRRIKAPSREKVDISMQIHDINTGFSPEVGFSIKSDIGATPTLLNSGKNTRIKYKVSGITEMDVSRINNIDETVTREYVIARMEDLFRTASSVEYVSVKDEQFTNNLIMIDSLMPQILGELVLGYYHDLSAGVNSLAEQVERLVSANPIHYLKPNIYKYKIKKLLAASALGMTPGKEWDGLDSATGGYIIIKRDGNILCYHLYNRNFFEKYLLSNTAFDRPSLSKFEYGFLYYENNDVFIDLNFQIRFKRIG